MYKLFIQDSTKITNQTKLNRAIIDQMNTEKVCY